MSANLTFELKDKYTTTIWNPRILNPDEKIKSLHGEYFFSVIYSVHREKNNSVEPVALLAKKTLSKFSQELGSFENELSSQTKILEMKKNECVFNLSFSSHSVNKISFSPTDNSGVCPENAAFLRAFIAFDKYISLLGEIRAMAIIPEDKYYIDRKTIQSKMRGIMEGYNKLIKQFHSERKKTLTESAAA